LEEAGMQEDRDLKKEIAAGRAALPMTALFLESNR
jgi:hypothetical protein